MRARRGPVPPPDTEQQQHARPHPAGSPRGTLDLTVHIGTGKTGTSSIQQLLHQNRERLAGAGHLYPRSPGATRHTRISLMVKSDEQMVREPAWTRMDASSPDAFRARVTRRLVREITRSGLSRVLLSDEALYGSPDDALRRLRTLTDEIAGRLRLVVYLRRQDDHLISRYQQVVKVGEVRRLDHRVQQLDLSSTYDYHARLSTWRRLLEPDEFVVRRFERDAFLGGSLYRDFLDAAGLEVPVDDLAEVTVQNESLDAESVEFLRILNLHRVEHEGARPGAINNRQVVGRLARASSGPILTLPEDVLDEFMGSWEESNRAVARDFLAEGPTELFRTPRKTSNTTTVQHLEPDRVDHFLAVAELPGRLRDGLRRLAEREAAAG